MDEKIGKYSFIIGVIIAVVLGLGIGALAPAVPALTSILVVLGLIVGSLNVAGKESKEFLMVAVILVIVASLGGSAYSALGSVLIVGPYIAGILNAILAFVVPATVIVALKQMRALAE